MADPSLEAYYSARAAEYEAIYRKPERQAHLAALKDYLRPLFSGCDVLEPACGTGYWTAVIAPHCRSVLALDASDEVLNVARAKPWPDANVRFAQADAYALDTIPGGFDAGFAGFWWSHIPRQRLAAFLAGFHGRLRAGARVCFIDNRYVEGSSTPVAETDAYGNTYQIRRLKDGSAHRVLKNFPADSEFGEALDGVASGVEVNDFKYYWCLTYRLT